MKILKFGIVIAIAFLFVIAKAPPSPKFLGGGCLEADILFITDWSGSIQGHEKPVVNAFASYIAGFTLSPDGVKIGIMTFSGSAELECPLTADRDRLDSSLMRLRFRVPGGDTKLSPALEYSPNVFNQSTIERDKTASMQIIIFMSDGDGTDKEDAVASAQILKDQGVLIYVIGIGMINDFAHDALLKIASPNSYLQIDYESLKRTLQRMDLCG